MKSTDKLFELSNVDAIVVISDKNRFYFTGFASTFGYLILMRGNKSVFITDPRYYEMAQILENDGVEVVQVVNGGADKDILVDVLKNHEIVTVGYEDTELTVSEHVALKNKFKGKGFKLEPVGNSINFVRSFKTEEEIEYIRKAQSITDIAFTKILEVIKPGISEKDIAIELEYIMAKNGAEGLAFDTIIASGLNSSKPHAHPSDKLIEIGDPVTMDFGARYHGYCSDMTRTVFVGEPSDEMRKIYNVVLLAQKMGITNAYCGMTGKELDSFCREVIKSNGYENYFVHGTGHSLGIDIHEHPNANARSKEKICAKQFITCEPGIYIPGLGGVRIEDLLLVEQDSVIDLTTSDKNIIIL
ncbi:MAG: aminopeptidase P family protein [Clostridiales bacterium]|nr:aminopeptidase P family protein [Clostridiales bacterium]